MLSSLAKLGGYRVVMPSHLIESSPGDGLNRHGLIIRLSRAQWSGPYDGSPLRVRRRRLLPCLRIPGAGACCE
jgi:hypothetical protein